METSLILRTDFGHSVLVEMGMTDLAFEAIVLRHPDSFSSETIERARQRLKDWNV